MSPPSPLWFARSCPITTAATASPPISATNTVEAATRHIRAAPRRARSACSAGCVCSAGSVCCDAIATLPITRSSSSSLTDSLSVRSRCRRRASHAPGPICRSALFIFYFPL
ncbi:MAG: hypothetical protein IJ064_04845 [Bacteroidaceae bacterium]|nr:hypothetical protein [Bacteroidaceae bacterium]